MMVTHDTSLRVLLVDPNERDRQLTRRSLATSGLPVTIDETADPVRGRALAIGGRCDCVVLDVSFPTGNAFDLFGDLLVSPSVRRPGIVFLTGSGDERIAAEAIQRGAHEYLTKSTLNPDSIRRAVELAYQRAMRQREIERRDERLMRMSFHDSLTGLPNRQLFFDRLGQATRDAARTAKRFAVLMMDLDKFKEVNDTLGHQAGDDLLCQVSERMQGVVRDSDTVARLGGDEFSALLSTADTRAGAEVVARKIVAAVEEPFLIAGQVVHVGISVGVALYPDHGTTPELLVRRADMALLCGKGEAGGVTVHGVRADDDAALVAKDLEAALAENELLVMYQPQVCLDDGAVVGVEALVRWRHPMLGLLPPTKFIPVAERCEIIEALTLRVVGMGLQQQQAWRARGIDLLLAVNLSARLFEHDHIAEGIASLLQRTDVPPHRLCLEVTEAGIMRSPERAERTLDALSELGVQLSIDDFGTGYSSLRYLRTYPIDEIKIDRLFVSGLLAEPRDGPIIKSVLALGDALDLRVVAEGIEEDQVWQGLRDLGCRFGQGYGIAPPLSVTDFDRWRSDWNGGVAAA